jgi:hypothetical protein
MRWFNREKLVFLGSGVALCFAAFYAASARPAVIRVGAHRAPRGVPGPISVRLQTEIDPIGGENPFAPPARRRETRELGGRNRGRAGARENDRDNLEEILKGLKGRGRPADRERGPEEAKEPRPYELPANYRGTYRPEGGRWRVILQDKRTRELRSLFEGDLWPSLKLRIIRITSDSVLLTNEQGRRYLMRGWSGRRSAGRASGPARAEPRG